MQRMRHLVNTRMFQSFIQNRQALVERHARLQQMRELLCENEQLRVWNLQVLLWRSDFRRGEQPQFSLSQWQRGSLCCRRLGGIYDIDSDRNAVLRFNLPYRKRAISAVEHPLNQIDLRGARTISKLWQR